MVLAVGEAQGDGYGTDAGCIGGCFYTGASGFGIWAGNLISVVENYG
jgi:hypothetical protein